MVWGFPTANDMKLTCSSAVIIPAAVINTLLCTVCKSFIIKTLPVYVHMSMCIFTCACIISFLPCYQPLFPLYFLKKKRKYINYIYIILKHPKHNGLALPKAIAYATQNYCIVLSITFLFLNDRYG